MKCLSVILSLNLCLCFFSKSKAQDYLAFKQYVYGAGGCSIFPLKTLDYTSAISFSFFHKYMNGRPRAHYPGRSNSLAVPAYFSRPVYLKTGFIFLLITALGILVWAFTRYRAYTLRKRSDKLKIEVFRRTQIIEQQKKELEASNRFKDKYMVSIGHDLRTPLLSLNGMSRKLRYLIEEGRYEDLQKLGRSIERSSSNMIKLVDNMFSWNLMQKDQYRIRMERLNIVHLIFEVLDLYKSSADEKNISIRVENSGTPLVRADRSALLTVLRNLVDNAIKFTNRGGEILIKCNSLKDQIDLRIENGGKPISEKQIAYVQNNERAKLSNGKGSGLGLLICKELIEMNQGQFTICNNSTNKTVVTIKLQMAGPK